jgi:hypothetical protein
MPDFPDRECEIFELAHQMGFGLTHHVADFHHAVGGLLLAKRQLAINGYTAQQLAAGRLRLATAAKEKALQALVAVMRQCLKRSEADVSSNPEKLAWIGWGPKAPPTPIAAPGAPTDLIPVCNGMPGELKLEWQKPADGGPVRNYIIQRRDQNACEVFGPWRNAGLAYDATIGLVRQPRGVRMEYRIVAVNKAGESSPGNTISAVL